MRELEERRAESHSFLPKLQDKLRKLQEELTNANRSRADAEQLSQLAENRLIDAQEQLEMVMLDKEVAEEKAEIAEAELEEVKEKLAVTAVENDVLKKGASKLILLLVLARYLIQRFPLGDSGDDKPIKNSLAYIQLEKQNERLKEALIKWAISYQSLFHYIMFFFDVRLRDMSQETHQEHRKRISEMEKDVATVDKLEGLLAFSSDSLLVMPSISKRIFRRNSYQTC